MGSWGRVPLAAGVLLLACSPGLPTRPPFSTHGAGLCSRGPGVSAKLHVGDVEGRCLWRGSRVGFNHPVRSMGEAGTRMLLKPVGPLTPSL